MVERYRQVARQMRRKILRFYDPMIIFVVLLGAGVGYAVVSILRMGGYYQSYYLIYYIPMLVPFAAYGADRLRQRNQMRIWQWGLDALVLTISVVRAFKPWPPFISGHAFFLTYVMLTARSWVAWVAAAVIMLEVIYLKVFVWQDWTLFGGIAAGLVCAFVFRWIGDRYRSGPTD